ncbi:hybrid sensor histidine kinase/response regulator [Vibrio hepatarius]|nr:hybrid sensor histidine kinase/response regulator [Vibrio hepatarius]
MEGVKKVYLYAEPNLTLVGWMGMFGFPTYYYIWTYLFPQPYENLILRIVCSILFSIIAFRKKLPKFLHKYMPQYYLISIGFCLPFFFSFMMFMNEWSTIWAMSFMASIFLHILTVYQTRIMLIQTLISVSIAYGVVYGVDFTLAMKHIVFPYMPIFIFTYIFGNLFYLRNQIEHESKVSIAKSFGAGIAHEMRNPLSAIKSSIDVMKSTLPNENVEIKEHYSISRRDLISVKEILTNSEKTISIGNETIDLLLTSIDENRISISSFKKSSLMEIIKDSLKTIPFNNGIYHDFITFKFDDEAYILGSETLVKYVIYNLIKNSFHYQDSKNLKIEIDLKSFDDYHELNFLDNGAGIPESILEDIFKDFFTYGKKGGSGLGLPFCRRVMNALRGKISCSSKLNEWTNFTLTFPSYNSNSTKILKMDITKYMSTLYLGDENKFGKILCDKVSSRSLKFSHLTFKEIDSKEEYEFEYDLIFIDLDEILNSGSDLKILEKKLRFTEARIIYLYDIKKRYHCDINRYSKFFMIAKNRLENDFDIVLDELLFDIPQTNLNQVLTRNNPTGKTIVVADDSQSICTHTAIILEQQGFNVIKASNGQEVLNQFKTNIVDLVIMDIEMPKVDGLEAASKIRLFSNIPILAHTGDGTQHMIEKIYDSGMNGYIIKPADGNFLIDKVSSWV